MNKISKESFCKVMNFIKSKDSDNELFNKALSQTKIEFNTWLSEAKSSLYYGNWSSYYFIRDDINNLTYLL